MIYRTSTIFLVIESTTFGPSPNPVKIGHWAVPFVEPLVVMNFFVSTIIVVFLFPGLAFCQTKASSDSVTTWTYTYLRAKEGRKDLLHRFIRENWFAMDSMAVQQGLFRQYELIENLGQQDSLAWDFMVAVEYYTEGTYADIAESFERIRDAHSTVRIDGLDFPALGTIVASETVRKHPKPIH